MDPGPLGSWFDPWICCSTFHTTVQYRSLGGALEPRLPKVFEEGPRDEPQTKSDHTCVRPQNRTRCLRTRPQLQHFSDVIVWSWNFRTRQQCHCLVQKKISGPGSNLPGSPGRLEPGPESLGLHNDLGVWSLSGPDRCLVLLHRRTLPPRTPNQNLHPYLCQQYEGDPLVILDDPSFLVWLRDVLVKRQVVGVLHPAVGIGELVVVPGEVLRSPALDRVSYPDAHRHDDGEHDEHNDRGFAGETVCGIIVVFPVLAGQSSDEFQDFFHPGFTSSF